MLERDKVYYKPFFYILLFSNITIFFILLFFTGGESAAGLLYADKDGVFMDFFNSLLQNSGDPYDSRVMYPPLSNCMYRILYLFIPRSAVEAVVTQENVIHYSSDVLKMQQFILPFMFYVIVTTSLLFFALVKYKGGNRKEKVLFCTLCFFSGSMLFAFERANSVIVVFIGILLFLGLKDSPKKILREIGIVALAVATGMKIYPIVFFVLLFNEKRYKELIRGLIYCLLLFIGPMFLFYGGFSGIAKMLGNLSGFSSEVALYTKTQLNFSKMIIWPLSGFDLSNETLLAIGNAFNYILSVGCVVAMLFCKKKWQILCACVCLICGFQSTAATYLLILFIIPAAAFIDNEKENKIVNYIYIAMMTIIITSPAVINPSSGKWCRLVGTKITSYLMLALTVMLIFSGVKSMCKFFEKKLNIKPKVTVLSFALMLIVIAAGTLFVAPGGLTAFTLLDLSFIFSSELIKLVLFVLLGVMCFAGIMFLAWWLPKDDKYNGFRQFVKFGIVGVSNTFVSLAVYYIFYFISEDLYFVGNAVGFIVSVLNAYYWNSKFVFKEDKSDAGKRKNGAVLFKTYLCYGSTFLLSEVMIIVEVELLGISGVIAPVINLLVTIPLNYILNKFFAYGEKKVPTKENSSVADNEEK